MKAIRSVSLDVGWTLAYPRRSIWQIFADVAGEAGKSVSPKELEDVIRQLWLRGQHAAVEHFRSGATYEDSDEQFTAAFHQMGALVFTHFGVPGNHADLTLRFFEAFWTEDNWSIFPEVLDVIEELRRRGLRVGVLSNAPTNLPMFLDRLGISPHLDFVVVSAMEGIKKPDRRIFETVVSRAGVEPAETLHVGDMYLEDVLGGSTAGLRTLLIERGTQALFPSHRESEGRELSAEHVVTDLRQILERMP
jgi:HAD superfamily hydrolase (TIGR01549 family)